MTPCSRLSIFSRLVSTQVTSSPISAKHAPETSPTYPVPTIAIFIGLRFLPENGASALPPGGKNAAAVSAREQTLRDGFRPADALRTYRFRSVEQLGSDGSAQVRRRIGGGYPSGGADGRPIPGKSSSYSREMQINCPESRTFASSKEAPVSRQPDARRFDASTLRQPDA